MASYETGYEDELFQYPVGPSLHCCICTNVIKDPVMCDNEHIFCKACITRHLTNSQTCPTCMQPLTIETLKQATRGIRNLLSELKIRCEFFSRGCGKFIQLGDLKRHVADCGFAPAVCSNEGCELEVNKQDLLHHETAVCELRRVQCHSCNDIRREMDAMKISLAAISKKLVPNENSFDESLKSNVENITSVVETVASEIKLVQEQLNKQKENDDRVEMEMRKSLSEIAKQMERMAHQHEVRAEQMRKEVAEAGELDREPKVVIAGGGNGRRLNSVEMFSLVNGTWTPLQPMRECRSSVFSVVYNNHIFVLGGWSKTVEKLSLNVDDEDVMAMGWVHVPSELLAELSGHCCVVYNGRLIVIGGLHFRKFALSGNVTEISLVPPYATKRLATMRQRRCYHGVALFGDVIVIVGGREAGSSTASLRSVVMYDITRNVGQELAPLPYPVSEMATVKWGDDNVITAGGIDNNNETLKKVLMYNVKTQKSYMLPDMKYQRKGCVAAVVKDTVIVMGGQDEKGNYLRSVEGFRFDRYGWEELPEMKEARWGATAVVY